MSSWTGAEKVSDSHRDLIAWQKAMALVTDIYASTRGFPREEIYGLTNQLRRAATSVPSNIAEGKGRLSKKEYAQFLSRSRGSILEVQTQLEIASNLGYLGATDFARLSDAADEVGRLVNGLLSSVLQQVDEAASRIRDAEPSDDFDF